MSELHHIALTVSNLGISTDFYGGLLKFVNFTEGHRSPKVAVWHGKTFEIILYEANPDILSMPHKLYAPGYHHVALSAQNREVVDQIGEWLIASGHTILDSPKEYPNYPGDYYAVFFLDPDGLKWEVMTN